MMRDSLVACCEVRAGGWKTASESLVLSGEDSIGGWQRDSFVLCGVNSVGGWRILGGMLPKVSTGGGGGMLPNAAKGVDAKAPGTLFRASSSARLDVASAMSAAPRSTSTAADDGLAKRGISSVGGGATAASSTSGADGGGVGCCFGGERRVRDAAGDWSVAAARERAFAAFAAASFRIC